MNLDANDESYVPLLRKIKTSPAIRSGSMARLILWLLSDAAYFDRTDTVPFQYGTASAALTMGESFINVKEVAAYLRIPERTFRRDIDRLIAMETITVEHVRGGLKVKLVNAERHWNRWAKESRVPPVNLTEQMAEMCTHSDTSQERTYGSNGAGDCHKGAVNLPDTMPTSSQNTQEIQGLGSRLESVEQQRSTDVCSKNTLSTKNEEESLVVGVGAAAQLDLIAPDPVPVDSRDDEIEISQFFGEKEERQWNELKHNVKWIRSMLASYEKTFILQQLRSAYQWWIENPRKRSKNTAAFLGGWMRREKKDLSRPAGRNQNRTTRIQAPVEPGKYDGIGITLSAYED